LKHVSGLNSIQISYDLKNAKACLLQCQVIKQS